MTIQSIAVLGGGQMGSGIAQVAALAGYPVTIIDIKSTQLDLAKKSISHHLSRQVDKGILTADQQERADACIRYQDSLKDLENTDLLIEAVSENIDLKIQLLTDVDGLLKKEGIIASNTSSISLTRLAAATQRPDRVIGMHFMNPVPVMALVEVIQSLTTSVATFTAVAEVIAQMGKTMVVSKDAPGFIVNRILMPMINEAIFTFSEGIASAQDIDTAMKLGTNQPMGPLALADLIGLDTCLAIMHVLHHGFGDSKYRPCPLLANYVAAGWLGRKTGQGFYEYGEKRVSKNVA